MTIGVSSKSGNSMDTSLTKPEINPALFVLAIPFAAKSCMHISKHANLHHYNDYSNKIVNVWLKLQYHKSAKIS